MFSLGLSHLQEHKFNHRFQDTLSPLCSCGLNIETTSHYFLHCLLFHAERSFETRILLCGNESLKDEVNLLILNATIDFVLSTNRFDEPLYLLWIYRYFSFYFKLYGYNFTIFKVLIFTFSYYLFCIPGTHNSHGARWLLFLCLLCKCSFP